MKKLLFAVSALAALSLLAPSTGFAQHVYDNQVGMFTTNDGMGATGTSAISLPVDVYLVLIRPVNTATGLPYNTINAFECMLNFDPNPLGNLFKLADAFPPTSLNVGDNSDLNQGFLEYIVGIGTDWPVTDQSVWLISFQFMALNATKTDVTLTATTKPNTPGEMAYQSVSGDLRRMYNASGTEGGVVFAFNGGPVAVENESFGSLKALYR